MSERKGFLTPNQESKLDELIELNGVAEIADGPAIRIADNTLFEKIKGKLSDETKETVYEIIDQIFLALGIEAE